MAKAGFCKECNKNVWLKKDGSCENGHSASSVANAYEAKDKTKESEKKRGSFGFILIIAGIAGIVLFGCIGCTVLGALALIGKQSETQKKRIEVTRPDKEPKLVELQIYSPDDMEEVKGPTVEIRGRTESSVKLTVNDAKVAVDSKGLFKTTVYVNENYNTIRIRASKKGKLTATEIVMVYKEPEKT